MHSGCDNSPMAALTDAYVPDVVELRRLSADDLWPVLEEETAAWRRQLDWDFRASADLVRRFTQMQALNGFALMSGPQPIGYSYYVCEERKGLIGDTYVLEQHRTVENENLLLAAVLENLIATPYIRRVESQLMMLRSSLDRPLPQLSYLCTYPRLFMEASLANVESMRARPVSSEVLFENWTDRYHDDAAHVIAGAYHGHVDSQINDQYRSASGARRFLMNIIQYPGCGRFFQPASFVAIHSASGRLCGISLTSQVSGNVGHITQICVLPAVKGSGIGYELLRRSLNALASHGCHHVSLTVTASNLTAVRLYERTGFSVRRTFAAYVWEGF